LTSAETKQLCPWHKRYKGCTAPISEGHLKMYMTLPSLYEGALHLFTIFHSKIRPQRFEKSCWHRDI